MKNLKLWYHLGYNVPSCVLFTFHRLVLVSIWHKPINFKELGTRTGEMHSKETGLEVMFHLGLPARSGKIILLALQHTYCTLDQKYRYPRGGDIIGRAAKIVSERWVLCGLCCNEKWEGKNGNCVWRGKDGSKVGYLNSSSSTASWSFGKSNNKICLQGEGNRRPDKGGGLCLALLCLKAGVIWLKM